MIRIVKVTGDSLSPFFLPGDYVIAWTPSGQYKKLSPGDIVVFNHIKYGILIKRIIHNEPSEKWVEAEGIHPESLTSQKIGRIPYENVLGKVIHRFPRNH